MDASVDSLRPVNGTRSRSSRSERGSAEDWTEELQDVPTSRAMTIFTFVLGDLVGGMLLLGGVHFSLKAVLPLGTARVYPELFGLLPGLLGVMGLAGLYRQRFRHPAVEMRRVAAVIGMLGGTVAFTLGVMTGRLVPALPVVVWTGLGLLLMPLVRCFTRVLGARASWWGVPAVVVTAEEREADILQTLRRWPEIGLRPVAVLTAGGAEEASISSNGTAELAPYLGQNFSIPYAIVSIPSLSDTERATLQLRYAKFFEHVITFPDRPSPAAFWATDGSGEGLFGYSVRHAALRPVERFVKRAMDLVGATLLTLLLSPLLLGIAVAVARGSRGGVLYRQERMGLEGRIFTVLKFRTMYEDADERLAEILETDPERRREYERYHKLENDPRVTPVGELLRRFSLDELPQLFNVLRGEMSLVGPRAYMPSELPEMNRLSRAILQVPPGITGLWQVSGRNDLSFSERVHLDLHYVQNWSLWMDLYLLVRTVPTVVTGEGAA